jgi:hypothetical protein
MSSGEVTPCRLSVGVSEVPIIALQHIGAWAVHESISRCIWARGVQSSKIRWSVRVEPYDNSKHKYLWIFNVKLSMLGGIAGEAEEPGDEEYFNLTKVTTET